MEVRLDNPHHGSSVATVFANYFYKEDYVDVTFVCAGGMKVKGHKVVLSVLSPFLNKMFLECNGNQDMLTVILPDVNANVLKLFFDFVYEGTAKLSKRELEEFKTVQDMLDIRFPGVVLNECFVQDPPRTGPPPLVKLKNRIQSGLQTTSDPHNTCVGGKQESESTATANDNYVSEDGTSQPSSPINDPHPRSGEPDDDPLNVPDFYFVPTDSRDIPSVGGCSMQNTNSKEHSQPGVRKRTYAYLANDTDHSVDVPSTVNSEKPEQKRTGKKKKGTSYLSCTDSSASNVMDTGGMQTRNIKTRKI